MNLPPQVVKEAESVYALVLAAGTASRFGSTKQVAEIDGVPMVRRAVSIANRVCGENTVIVTGHDAQAVAAACEPLRGAAVFNEYYDDGLGTSIACGVRSVRDTADAVIIMLADQPLVTAEHIQALIDSWSGDPDEIVATSFSGTQGPPVLFGKECFDSLCKLRGDTGAKSLFNDQRYTLKAVPFEPAAIDIDSPEQLKAREH